MQTESVWSLYAFLRQKELISFDRLHRFKIRINLLAKIMALEF